MKPTSIIEEERRRKISRGTKAALAVRKAQGVKLGGLNAQSIRNRDEARELASHCGLSLRSSRACPHARLPES